MCYNTEFITDEIIQQMKKLPEQLQLTLLWAIENYDFVRAMCENSSLSTEEIRIYMHDAIEKEDYLLLTLLCIKEHLNTDSYTN